MRRSNISFANLRAEMSRKNIGILDMANVLGCNRDTLARKLSQRSALNLDEAFTIQQTFFPGLDVAYLFAESGSSDQTGE